MIVNPPLLWTGDKGQYIKDEGLAGFAMWEAGGDYKDILLDAIKSGVDSH
jgi:GH18 family chitinase